ncbi:MAG: histidinol dehydrogenase [Opitutales bacterium]|nr:histidinol dehydrogenase [Opitutales bacterium]
MLTLKASDPGLPEILQRFEQNLADRSELEKRVTEIITSVKDSGDEAIFELTERFDKAKIDASNFRVNKLELVSGKSSLSDEELSNIEKAKSQIEAYHLQNKPENWLTENGDGGMVGERHYPIRAVGLYVPGGNVPLVSSVLMSAVLAKIAGNPRIVVVTPPLPDGSIAPGMLAALEICGVDEIYKVGGAQAIAALAYGTQIIEPVDKVFGPGNAYVLEAKRQVFGQVGVDLLPGPSEIGLLADETANPDWIAADLLAQAEHGSGKERVLFLSSDNELIQKVEQAIEEQLPQRIHSEAIRKVIQEKFVRITYSKPEEAVAVLNQFAPEHLEIQVNEDSIDYYLENITTAGAMLVGHHTPTVLGDFTAGPSHTLPTGGAGRFMSGLRLADFMRRTSVVRYDAKSIQKAAPVVRTFSKLEQLDAHGNSLEIRLES